MSIKLINNGNIKVVLSQSEFINNEICCKLSFGLATKKNPKQFHFGKDFCVGALLVD